MAKQLLPEQCDFLHLRYRPPECCICNLTGEVAQLKRENVALAEALERVVPRCGFIWSTIEECYEIGVWFWEDPTGCEWKCDKHKNENLHSEGPELDEDMVNARDILAALKNHPNTV